MFFYRPKLLVPILPYAVFVSSSLSVGWYCGAGVLGRRRSQSLSSVLILSIFLNNNNNNK